VKDRGPYVRVEKYGKDEDVLVGVCPASRNARENGLNDLFVENTRSAEYSPETGECQEDGVEASTVALRDVGCSSDRFEMKFEPGEVAFVSAAPAVYHDNLPS
jgi:hypothetical protein